jgi:FkbM family methyltransferase
MSLMKKYKKKFDAFKVILSKSDPMIIEIGAHFGEDSMRFAEVFPNATIHCFEPDPRCVTIFKKHVKNKNVFLHEIALSNVDGELEFFQGFNSAEQTAPEKYDWISDEDYKNLKLGNSGASSLKRGYDNVLENTIKVKSTTYHKWSTENKIDQVDLAWIDVQGAEKDVLNGMGDKLKHVRFIWIEYGEMFYHDSMSREQTVAMLSSKNFEVIEELSDRGSKGDLLFERREK